MRRFPAIALPGTAWLIALFAVPVGGMLAMSLQEGNLEDGFRYAFDLAIFPEAVTSHSGSLARSVVYAATATAIALALGYPLAYAIAHRAGRWRAAILGAVVLPFFVSFVIRALALRQLLADSGPVLGPAKDLGLAPDLRVLATPVAVIAGLVYTYLPLVVLPVYATLTRIDRRLVDAAKDLGARPFTAFRTVTWPLSRPGVIAGTLLASISCFGDYLNAELLGGTGTSMVGTSISRSFLRAHAYPEAAALSLVVLAVAMVPVVLALRNVPASRLAA